MRRVVIPLAAAIWVLTTVHTSALQWQHLEPGIDLVVVEAPVRSSHGDSRFTVVRVDPALRQPRLLMASELGFTGTAAEWAEQQQLAVVVNAGMFDVENPARSAFYMKGGAHINNPKVGKANTFLAFDRSAHTVPRLQIIDRTTQPFDRLQNKYNTLIQGIRMVSRDGRNTWGSQPKKWSMVVAAADRQDRLLLIFTRSPYRVHDFVNMLLGLPLAIRNMMYLEGGPEASLYIRAGGRTIEQMGSYETGFNENDGNDHCWPIPNVIGIPRLPDPEATSHPAPGP